MYGYEVEIDAFCEHSEYSDEAYWDWSESYSNTFKRVSKETKYPDVVSALDISVGEQCFVVWAEWSSGDSFGRGDRNHTESLGIFVDEGSAKQLACFLKLQKFEYEQKKQSHVRVITCDDEQLFDYTDRSLPWDGYFESLDEVYVSVATME